MIMSKYKKYIQLKDGRITISVFSSPGKQFKEFSLRCVASCAKCEECFMFDAEFEIGAYSNGSSILFLLSSSQARMRFSVSLRSSSGCEEKEKKKKQYYKDLLPKVRFLLNLLSRNVEGWRKLAFRFMIAL